ncbi:MAG: endo-1,4-beta-xylanase, partial [Promicromonosporaceae bacterium]|nr:endo-1,4-beta-xylanase [Promicromonosporaceae bacterium]
MKSALSPSGRRAARSARIQRAAAVAGTTALLATMLTGLGAPAAADYPALGELIQEGVTPAEEAPTDAVADEAGGEGMGGEETPAIPEPGDRVPVWVSDFAAATLDGTSFSDPALPGWFRNGNALIDLIDEGGNTIVALTRASDPWDGLSGPVNVLAAGNVYELSARVRMVTPATGTRPFEWRLTGAGGWPQTTLAPVAQIGAEWQTVTRTLTNTANDGYRPFFGIGGTAGNNGTVFHVDYIEVHRVVQACPYASLGHLSQDDPLCLTPCPYPGLGDLLLDDPLCIAPPSPYLPLRDTFPGIVTGVAVHQADFVGAGAATVARRNNILGHYDHLVMENHHKPDNWFTGPGTGTGFHRQAVNAQARAAMNFALEHDMTLFGHVIVWHSQTPAWFWRTNMAAASPEMTNTPENQQEMLNRLTTWIEGIGRLKDVGIEGNPAHPGWGPFGGPGNPMNGWEVANEVVAGGPGWPGGLRANSPWTRIFTPYEGSVHTHDRFLIHAFFEADRVFNCEHHIDRPGRAEGLPYDCSAPGAFRASGENRVTLWINDYNTERGLGSPDNPATKRYQFMRLANALLDAGAPLDGVGHQFHAGLEWPVRGLYYALEYFAWRDGAPQCDSLPAGSTQECNWIRRPVLQAVTEIDVTITDTGLGNIHEMMNRQAHYYRESFDVIRRHHARFGDIDNVTLWGIDDQRSWRSGQRPLLHWGGNAPAAVGGASVNFTAKPAFFGAVYSGDMLMAPEDAANFIRPVLPVLDQEVLVFEGSVPLTAASFDGPYWNQLPARTARNAADWHARWSPNYLTVLATIHPSWVDSSADGYVFDVVLDDQVTRVGRSGIVARSGGATAITAAHGGGYRAIVRIPHSAELGDSVAFDLRVYNASGDRLGEFVTTGGTGTLEFETPLAYVPIPRTDERPVFDGVRDELWDNAQRIEVNTLVSGDLEGATATAYLMWYETDVDRLLLFIDVTDPDVVAASGAANADGFVNQPAFGANFDSIELMFDIGNARAGALRGWYDLRLRISPNGQWSRPHGDGNHNNRIVQGAGIHTTLTETGWTAELELHIGVGTGHQLGQWNTALGGIGAIHGFDLRVIDGDGSARTSVHSWATSAVNGDVNSYRWGAFELVEDLPPPAHVFPSGPGVVSYLDMNSLDPDADLLAQLAGWHVFGDNVTLSLVPDPADPSRNVLRISGREDITQGLRSDLGMLTEDGRYAMQAAVRVADPMTGTGVRQARFISTSNGAAATNQGNVTIGNVAWTSINVGGYAPRPGAQLTVGGTQPATGNFDILVDFIRITRLEPLVTGGAYLPLRDSFPGIVVGSAVNQGDLVGGNSEILRRHYNHLVMENHHKPDSWFTGPAGDQGPVGFHRQAVNGQARAAMNFALEHDMTVFGHVLIWHSQTPSWWWAQNPTQPAGPANPEMTNTPENQQEMLDRVDTWIEGIGRLKDAEWGAFGSAGNPMNGWEVANEVVAGGPGWPGGLRANSPWTRIFTPYEGSVHTHDRFLIHAFFT